MTPALQFPHVSRVFLCVMLLAALPLEALPQSRTYTTTADFNEGSLINLVSGGDELKLSSATESFGFIWIAVSTKGTAVKIDTETGQILGEYRTAPQTFGSGGSLDPSRTTVDNNGSVWVTNRAISGFVAADAIAPGFPSVSRSMGSAVHIGLVENNECEDRNGNGTIETSTGQNDIRAWDAGLTGADNLGGVSTAEDECVIHYVRTNSTGTRHVSVTAGNDVWMSGTGGQFFDLFDGDTGAILRQEGPVGYGGYGGLIDGDGVIWSARLLLRWDTANPLSGPIGGNWDGYSHDSYGLCIDSHGNVWNTALFGNLIRKFAPDGTLLGTFSHGLNTAQGCVVDGNDHVWVAHSLIGGSTVGHILNDGTYIGNVPVGSGPTGVAVDAAGKIWATNYNSRTASRIDPAAGPIGADGVTTVGAVDFTTVDLGGNPYNYSDMTGSTLSGAPDNGAWSVVYNSGTPGTEWGTITWNADLPGDAALTVTAASSSDGVAFGPAQAVTDGADLGVTDGQYLRVNVAFARSTGGDSPVLYDLTVSAVDAAIACADAYPDLLPVGFAYTGDEYTDFENVGASAIDLSSCAWASWHPFTERIRTSVALTGILDPGDVLRVGEAAAPGVDAVTGSDPLYDGPGAFSIHGLDVSALTPGKKVTAPGIFSSVVASVVYLSDGTIFGQYPAAGVSKAGPDVSGLLESLRNEIDVPSSFALEDNYPNPFNPQTTIRYAIPEAATVELAIIDALGRTVRTLVSQTQEAGRYEVVWDGLDGSGRPVASGVYLYTLRAGAQVASRAMLLAK